MQTTAATNMRIDPYLSFDGDCEAALTFYAQALGGKVGPLMRYADSPMNTPELPDAWKNRVLHGVLEVGDQRLMAADNMPGHTLIGYHGFTVSINLPVNKARAEEMFHALSSDGTVTLPFGPTFWGAHFGMLKDRFGVPWMINCDGST